jgi:diguanylate cyclase (GGDEF)-like protein
MADVVAEIDSKARVSTIAARPGASEHESSGPDKPSVDRVPRPAIGLVLLVSSAMVGGAALFLAACACAADPAHRAPWWMVVLIVVGFGIAERFAFNVQFRREAISISLSEVPTALALAFLSPPAAIAARVLGSLVVLAVVTRPKPYKLVFNGALFTLEAAMAFFVVRRIADPMTTTEPRFLVAVTIGIVAASLVGSLAVATAIACFEGRLLEHLWRGWRVCAVVTPVSTTIAAVALAPALLMHELVLLALVPIAAVWSILRRHGQLVQQHTDLGALHGFAGAVGRSLRLDEIVGDAVAETARLLRAQRCALYVFDADGSLVEAGNVGGEIGPRPSRVDDPRWSEVVDGGRATWCRAGIEAVVASSTRRSSLATPVGDANGTIGLLAVAERTAGIHDFDASDRSRLHTMAVQLASTLRKALLHASIEHAATHDALTGGPNRAAFERAVDDRLAATADGCVAVLLLDLDRFKEVNDTLGHHAGDRVLVQFAERVRERLLPGDVLARLAGDEFAVLAHRLDVEAMRELAADLLSEARTPFSLDGIDVVVTASIGIAPLVDVDTEATSVMRRADIAMYAAKKAHAGFEVYREEIDRRTPARLSLLGDLRQALELMELTVDYQPKVDLVRRTVIGAEALVRWHHPGRGWVPPIDFVGVAEETGLIKQLTDQVMHQALGTLAAWRREGYDLGVSINLSTHDLLDELLVDRVAHRIEQHGLDPDQITLEITESSLLSDAPRTMSTIRRLDELGVRLAVDDFGTGYSSLSYLRRLPVSEIKIDRSFVLNLLLDEQDEVIVRSTIDLGHNLGLHVVAEGIESSPVLDRLGVLACDIGQGYGISRPLRPELFRAWLATTGYRVPRRPNVPAPVG